MKAYLDILNKVYTEGKRYSNRTGVDRFRVTGAMFEHDMNLGFPLLTTKEMNVQSILGELVGFINGYDNVSQFNEVGCGIWNANAGDPNWLKNPNRNGQGDLGRIYGKQWRSWVSGTGETIDQLEKAVNEVIVDPGSSRNIVQSFNPGELDLVCLPPCHTSFQLIADKKEGTLDLVWTQRSCDVFLGLPYNIASYGFLLTAIAHVTGYQPNKLVGLLSDVHWYENQKNVIRQQLGNTPHRLPELELFLHHKGLSPIEELELMRADDFILEGYSCCEKLPVQMVL
jgi:thymidylate synthase